MAWPFHCDAPVLRVLTEPDAVEVSWWRERDADKVLKEPLHRAGYTYVTWADQLPAAWGRAAPSAADLISHELASLGDEARCDGTCTTLTDATLSAVTTAYNPEGDSEAVALDYQPCVAEDAPDDAFWYRPHPGGYDAHGWVHRFAMPKGVCSLHYSVRRRIPKAAKRLVVVELGSTTNCARALCTGPEGDLLLSYGGDALVRRASAWNLADGSVEEDTALTVAGALVRTVGAAQRMAVVGTLSVADPLFWPGIEDLQARSVGPCAMAVDPFVMDGGRWVAKFSASCAYARVFDQNVTLSTSAWGSGVWARGGARRLVASIDAAPTEAPPGVTAAPAAEVVPLLGASSVRFGLTLSEDEAYWEVSSVGLPSFVTQARTGLTDAPPKTCSGSQAGMTNVTATLAGPAATVSFVNSGNNRRPMRTALCLDVTLTPVRPFPGTALWRSAAAASRFSGGGVNETVAPDGSPAYAAVTPLWDDGSPAGNPLEKGYPYRGTDGLAAATVSVVSPWVGLMSTAAAAPQRFPPPPSPAPPDARGGRSAIPSGQWTIQQSDTAAPAPAGTTVMANTAIALVAFGGLLFLASIIVLSVAIARLCNGQRRRRRPDDYHEDDRRSKYREDGRRPKDDYADRRRDDYADRRRDDYEDRRQPPREEYRRPRVDYEEDRRQPPREEDRRPSEEDRRPKPAGELPREEDRRPKDNQPPQVDPKGAAGAGDRRARVKGLGVARFMLIVLLPCCVSASTCGSARDIACNSCKGVLSPSTCTCTCGWSDVETVVYAMLLLPSVTMLMLYV